MGERYSVKDLRDMLNRLKRESEFLYQYGDLSSFNDLFNKLSLDDQKRLIYLALTKGDKDVKNVARYLMKKLNPAPKNFKELLTQISPEDITELESPPMEDEQLELTENEPLTTAAQQRIDEELQKACNKIGFLEVEEAYWILIPSDPAEETIWIEAVGGENKELSRVRIPTLVMYEPTKPEKHNLLIAMRRASCIIHVHNHPELPDTLYRQYSKSCQPSRADRNFALQWKSDNPEIRSKMKFFVVQGKSFVEY